MRRVIVFVALVMPWLIASATNTLTPHGYVNDFANIIPDEREAKMELELRAYEQKTSVEMVVVTTPSLDGTPIESWSIELATRWGIGKKDADNGLLLVIAPNEREYRVEVGYGLEGDVPDAVASRLSRNTLPKAFRAGDYVGGIESLLAQFMTRIGDQSALERARSREEREKLEAQAALERQKNEAEQAIRRKEQHARFMHNAFNVLIVLLAFGAVFLFLRFVISRVKEYQRKRLLRSEVLAGMTELSTKADSLANLFENYDDTNVPIWIRSHVERHEIGVEDGLRSLKTLKGRITAEVSQNPDDAKEMLLAFERNVALIQEHWDKLQSTDREVEQYRSRAAESSKIAVGIAHVVEALVVKMTNDGFLIDKVVTPDELVHIKKLVAETETALAKRGTGVNDASAAVISKAEHLKLVAGSVLKSLQAIRKAKTAVDEAHPKLVARVADVTDRLKSSEVVLRDIRSSSPEHVWKSVNDQFENVLATLALAGTLLMAARSDSSMAVQQFAEAEKNITKAQSAIEKMEAIHENIQSLDAHIKQAKEDVPDALRKAELAIAAATTSVGHGDSDSDSQRQFSEAKRKFSETQALLSAKPTDWLLTIATVLAVVKLATSAEKSAKDAIAEAEERRRRARRAAEQKAEADRQSRLRSIHSSSSSGSGGGGGFGGFGGGSFGGGGASGKW